jgi:hypothetical protein
MGFVRFRHDALGDIGRIQRQQMFLQAAVRKMLDPKSWLHLNALVDIAGRNTRTDLSNVDLFESLNFIHSVPRENIKFVMLPGEFGGNGDWLANTDGKALAQRLSDPDQESVTSRRNITVCIVNASSDRKLGGELSQALRKLGYITCVGKDDNDPVSSKTRIIAQNGNIANAKMMQQDLGGKGEVVNASVGNLMSSITIVAHDDLKLDEITMSTADAPYVAPLQRPQPLVDRPLSVPPLVKSSSAPLASADTDKQADIPSVLDGENEPDDKQAKPSISDDESKVGSDPKTAGDAKMGSDSKTAGDSTIGSEPNKSNDKQSSESPRTPSSETAKPAEAAGTSGTAEHSDALPGKSTSLPPTAPLPKSEERLAEPNNGQAIPITR